MRCAIYVRVSTKDKGQDTANQLAQLREFATRSGWEIVGEYEDHASGSKSDSARPGFRLLLDGAGKRLFDVVLFWALDRLSREGVLETLKYLERFTQCGVHYRSYTEPYFDSCGVFRDVIISIAATLARQERIRISERTLAGLDRARAQGKTLGPPRRILDRQRALEMRAQGISVRKIADSMNVGSSTIQRVLREAQA